MGPFRCACFCVHRLLVTLGLSTTSDWYTLECEAEGAACLQGRHEILGGKAKTAQVLSSSPLVE